MGFVECSVRPDGHSGWIAEIEGRAMGPYLSEDFALRIAVGEAQIVHRSGRAVCITVYNAVGSVRAKYFLSDQRAHEEAAA
jgi:hypothetical protein